MMNQNSHRSPNMTNHVPQRNFRPCSPSIFDLEPPPPPPTAPIQFSPKLDDANRDDNFEWAGIMLLAAIATLCTMFMITVTVYYAYFRNRYANQLREADGRSLRRLRISRDRRFSWRAAEDYFLRSPRQGLRRSMVDALPVFVYEPENFKDGLRCAVCLCEFEQNDKGRMLPNCNHSFHIDCIDMWFYSHSTCPLCRARIEDAQLCDQSVESGHREVEIPAMEESAARGEKALISSTSGSSAAEQHNECVNQNNVEGSGSHITIHISLNQK
ncbi:hypothetical protein KI387_037826 [Taxus chinensis]|uniref:RING-type E3 ubiquitin transferase n=1 Tax=Taxus chinensis TaxID=29808 RepID=A0AA38FTI7_TAXCH|nr:hypothetical protein KI387_037826 [Taxus chinensis]